MTSPIECVKCGSVLPQGAPGEILTCKFCSAETRVPDDDVRRAVVVVRGDVKPAGPALFFGVAIVLAVACIAAGVALLRTKPPLPPPAPVVTFTPPPAPPPKPLMKPSEVGKLAELPESRWEELDATEMPGRMSDFDFIGALPFATHVAKFWAQDAELADVALEGITPEGKLDLSAHEGWHAELDFLSRAMIGAQEKLREVGDKKVYTQLLFDVAKGKVNIQLGRGGGLQQITKTPVFECSQASVVAAFKPLDLKPRPTYTLRARYDSTSQWVWSIFVDGGPSPQPTVATASCKVVR